MPTPRTLTEIKAALTLMGVTPRKQRGQNFLCERGSVDMICKFAGVSRNDTVVEIGPGLGAISLDIARASGRYTAIEVEERFVELLRPELAALSNATIFLEDVREIDADADPRLGPRPLTIVSNVPYSLSTEVLLWIIRYRKSITRAVLLLQREFAERAAAQEGSKDYGSLSVLIRMYADARLGPKISGHCFYPRADVESRLLELRVLERPRYEVSDLAAFEQLVRAAFSHRRKTLLNSLADSGVLGDKSRVQRVLESAGLDPGRRAETLSLVEYVSLFGSKEALYGTGS